MESPTVGSVAFVTGARRGIGRAIAVRLAATGATVVVNDLQDTPELHEVARAVGGFAVVGDVSDAESVSSMVDEIYRNHGHIDILVSNAAFMSMEAFPPPDWSMWWRNIATNLSGTFLLLQAIVPRMVEAGGGHIIMIASETGVVGAAHATGYGASKAGLIALTKSLANELTDRGIRVNAVAPGFIDTLQLQIDATDAGVGLEEMRRQYQALVPTGAIGQPEDVAAAVAFLASRGGGDLSGEVLQPGGGVTRCRV